nr:pVI [Bearded dragon adenovirus 1]
MAFARLAPHRGLQPVYGYALGTSDLSGGFSWTNFGNSLSSGFQRFGNFLSNTATRVGNSQAFQQAKQGLLQSGVLENVGALAGQTLNTLTDIGRAKLDMEMQKLRDRALGVNQQAPAMSQEQLAQLLAALAAPQIPAEPAVAVPAPTPAVPSTLVPEVLPANPDAPVALGPVLAEPADSRRIRKPPRKRRRVSGWGAALEDMIGDGVSHRAQRFCY